MLSEAATSQCRMRAIVGIEKERDDATASRPAINLPRPSLAPPPSPPTRSVFAASTSNTNNSATMTELKDDCDLDMLFDENPELSGSQHVSDPFGPQLSRLDEHPVIKQIEAVFETIADALLNERADVTISLTRPFSNATQGASTRVPKAVFSFPGKTANDAWRFCRSHGKPSERQADVQVQLWLSEFLNSYTNPSRMELS